MPRTIALLLCLCSLSGCATHYYHTNGDLAPVEVLTECQSKCSYNNSRVDKSASTMCVNDCMTKQGYVLK
jgi:hypothetical protein